MEDVGLVHGRVQGGEAAVRGREDGRHQPDGEEDGDDRDPDAEDRVDRAQVMPAHGDVAPGAQDPAGEAEVIGIDA